MLDNESPAFTIGRLVPACKIAYDYADGGSVETRWLLAEDSWAAVQPTSVRQLGSRRLWDEVEAAYRWWEPADQPDYQRYGLTTTADRQSVWLDHPGQGLPSPQAEVASAVSIRKAS